MFKVKIIAMGKLTVPYLKDASADYVKRIGRSFSITVVEPKPEALPQAPSAGEIERALEREAERSGELSQSDVDAWLEESERRFEEARRQLDEQFEEAGRSEPGSELTPDED